MNIKPLYISALIGLCLISFEAYVYAQVDIHIEPNRTVLLLLKKARIQSLEAHEKNDLIYFQKQTKADYYELRILESEEFVQANPGFKPDFNSYDFQLTIDSLSFFILNNKGSNEAAIQERKLLIDLEWRRVSQFKSIQRTELPREPISDPVLLVVHASKNWDTSASARQGVNQVISQVGQFTKVIYLMDQPSGSTPRLALDLSWYTENTSPHFAFDSLGGEHSVLFRSNQVTVVGGYFGHCQLVAVRDLIKNYSGIYPLNVQFPIKAVYFSDSGGSATLEDIKTRKGKKYLKSILKGMDIEDLELNENKTAIEIHLEGELLHSVGSGDQRVIFNFVSD